MDSIRLDSFRASLPLALVFLAGAALPGTAGAQKPPVKRDLSQGNTLYVVPYSHLDTQWRWAYPQVIREYIPNTMRDNLALIAKYPNYTFNFSGSRRYEMMREYYPADFANVAAAIKAGRWFPCGSSVDEGDANVPSGESLVRHILYGNHYFRKEFGTASEEFMLPDCFGFPYALPSILAHCGLKGFSTQKLTWGSAVGIPFKVGVWKGPDGKSVVAALDPGAYTGDVSEDLSNNTSWLARIRNTGAKSGAFVDYHYYGTGDRGGAPNESSVNWVEKSMAGKGPVKVVSGRADEMFLNVSPAQRAKMPVYDGELLLTQHSAGSVTSQAYMKRWNRKNELLADAAERASVGAMWLGGAEYPSARLEKSWGLLLGSQMHDMLPGTSLPKAYEHCWNDEILAMNGFAEIARHGVATVAAAMDTRGVGAGGVGTAGGEGIPLVVYNPLGRAREEIVAMENPADQAWTILGPDGKTIPSQMVKGKLLFTAKVPANGFVAYTLQGFPDNPTGISMAKDGRTIENDRLRVTIDANGDIGSIYDKTAGREVLRAPARLDLQHHNPSQFPAWNMDWSDAKQAPYGHVDGPATVSVTESGPLRQTIEITRTTAGSKFVQRVSLDAGSDRVDVRATIDWGTPETALKASFPFAAGNPKATYDLQLGAIERGNNDEKKYEVPQHSWMDLTGTDGKFGAAVLNDSKYGSDKPDDNTLRLTLLYTPGVRGGYQDEATQDFGRHEVTYAIAPHAGDWRQGDVAWNAKRLNQPLQAFTAPVHAGELGKSFSLASTDSKKVEIQAIKKAEDSDEIVVRLRELEGSAVKGVAVAFASPVLSAREVDGQERPLGSANVVGGKLMADIDGYSLRTYAVKLAPSKTRVAKTKTIPIALAYDLDAASTDAATGDGDFDGKGRTFPAEMLPKELTISDVPFRLGATTPGAKNALVAKGQTITLPTGTRSIEVLTASSDGDQTVYFQIGDRKEPVRVQDWRAYVGQWDNRLWLGEVPELAYDWHNAWGGLVPGYIKPAEVAWFASHHHTREAGNAFYEYSQIFRHRFEIPEGTTTFTLPNDARVKVFAATAVFGNDETLAATPLMDTLDRTDNTVPEVVLPADANLSDAVAVTIRPPLYWRAGGLRYTTDGSEVTATSPVYSGPIALAAPTTIRTAEVDADGTVGTTAELRIEVNDVTGPKIVAAETLPTLGVATVTFSEPVNRTEAEKATNYRLGRGSKVTTARLSADGRTVELMFAPIPAGTPSTTVMETVAVTGVTDLSPKRNVGKSPAFTAGQSLQVLDVPTTAAEGVEMKASEGMTIPSRATDAWTMNVRIKPDAMPDGLALIAGFGRARDGRSGAGRYFAIFPTGLQFWSANQDVATNTPLTVGQWQVLTATFDGTTLRVYKDGKEVGNGQITLANDDATARLRPVDAWGGNRRFAGAIEAFTLWNRALSPQAVARLAEMTKGK